MGIWIAAVPHQGNARQLYSHHCAKCVIVSYAMLSLHMGRLWKPKVIAICRVRGQGQRFKLNYGLSWFLFWQSLEDFCDDEEDYDDRGYEEDNEDDHDYLDYRDDGRNAQKKEPGNNQVETWMLSTQPFEF